MYAEDLEALEVTVRAMEAKLREIRACIQREKETIPKAGSDSHYKHLLAWSRQPCLVSTGGIFDDVHHCNVDPQPDAIMLAMASAH